MSLSVNSPIAPSHIKQGGIWGQRLADTCREWMLKVSNDLLLDGFRNKPGIQPWIGEHVGKFLLGAIPTGMLIESPPLLEKIKELVEGLVACQEEDGYLATYLPEGRWLGYDTEGYGNVWDCWVHKYCILALLAYYDATGWEPALETARKAADLLINVFGIDKRDINKTDQHAGLASGSVLEPIMSLYQHTGDERYLAFGEHIVKRWDMPTGPQLVRILREEGDVCTIGKGKGYEMMSCFVGLLEYARAKQDDELIEVMLKARDRIADTQRYPTGGMTCTEFFWRPGLLPEAANNETCVAFTWIQLNLRLFEITGDERAIDLVEEAAWNQLLAALSPQGDTWSYHLSMTGPKRFFKKWVQAVKQKDGEDYGAAMTCCHTNGQRGLAMIPQYAYTVTDDGALAVNLYGPSVIETELPGAGVLKVEQQTEFPCDKEVTFEFTPEKDGEYEVRLRRPLWAEEMFLDGEFSVKEEERRLCLRMKGKTTIRLEFDMKPRVILCGFEARGKCAIAYGPLIMALDKAPEMLELDQVALRLGQGDIDAALTLTEVDGWPAVTVETAALPRNAASMPAVLPGEPVTLIPVLHAGLKDNPGLTQVIVGESVPKYNLDQKRDTLFPQYRVQLPFLWCP